MTDLKKVSTNHEETEDKKESAPLENGVLNDVVDEMNDVVDEKQERLSTNLGDSKESKETLTKSLEFEEDTFKIDSKGWKEEKRDVHHKGEVKVKVNATGDVVEYPEGLFEGLAKGEQIFLTYEAFIREVMKAKNCSKEEVEKKYLMTIDELKEKMKDKPDGSDEYNKFFNKEVEDHLAGCWYPSHKTFYNLGVRSSVWLSDGNNAHFHKDRRHGDTTHRDDGCSGRLLKN